MRWPWSIHRLAGRGIVVDAPTIKDVVESAFPTASGSIEFEPGDRPVFLAHEDAWLELEARAFPDIPNEYKPLRFDCEKFTRRRLAQLDDYIDRKTDLWVSAGLFEIRGKVWSVAEKSWLGHSMLIRINAKLEVALRQPFNGLEAKPLEFLKDPWLLYR